MNFIKYKGFKVLVMSNMPYSDRNEVYKVTADFTYDLDEFNLVFEALEFFSTVLGIKSEGVYFGKFLNKAPLGKDIRVFKHDGQFDLEAKIEKFYFITGVKGICPVDYNYQIKTQNPDCCLRP